MNLQPYDPSFVSSLGAGLLLVFRNVPQKLSIGSHFPLAATPIVAHRQGSFLMVSRSPGLDRKQTFEIKTVGFSVQ